MKKIYTKIDIDLNNQSVRKFSGDISIEETELILDLLDIVWHSDNEYDKKALKKIKSVVSEWEQEIIDNQ